MASQFPFPYCFSNESQAYVCGECHYHLALRYDVHEWWPRSATVVVRQAVNLLLGSQRARVWPIILQDLHCSGRDAPLGWCIISAELELNPLGNGFCIFFMEALRYYNGHFIVHLNLYSPGQF